MSEEELKKCPFCGGKSTYYYGSLLGDSYSESGEVHSVCCDDCEAYIYDDYSKDKCVEKWNKRKINE